MNVSEQIEFLRLVEEELESADVSKMPHETRVDTKELTNIAIGGHSHLPIERQLIEWAKAHHWLASEVPGETGVIRILKQQ